MLGLLLLGGSPAAAQRVRLRGEVRVASATDSVPLPRTWVVLHEVTMRGGGPRDSMRTDARGRFDLQVAPADTGALYMVSTTYRGITYFSEAITHASSSDTVTPIVVFDTSSVGPSILEAQRHIVVRGAGESGAGGGRSVLELVGLANDGHVTRVAGEPPRPTWVGRLPAGISDFTVGQGDLSPDAVQLVGDSVIVTAPIPPGVKQLVFTYDVPGGRELRIPIDQPADRILVLLADTTATVVEGPVMRRGVQVFNDTQFALFDGSASEAGGAMVFRFGAGGGRRIDMTLIVVGLAAVLLLIGLAFVLRRTPTAVIVPPPETPQALARAIAVLDAEHERNVDPTPAVEAAYRERRAALKAQLASALARARGAP